MSSMVASIRLLFQLKETRKTMPAQRNLTKMESWLSKALTVMYQKTFHYLSVAMPAASRREKIFDFAREFAVKSFRIVPVRDSTQQNKASNFSGKFRVVFRTIFRFEIKTFRGSFVLQTGRPNTIIIHEMFTNH